MGGDDDTVLPGANASDSDASGLEASSSDPFDDDEFEYEDDPVFLGRGMRAGRRRPAPASSAASPRGSGRSCTPAGARSWA